MCACAPGPIHKNPGKRESAPLSCVRGPHLPGRGSVCLALSDHLTGAEPDKQAGPRLGPRRPHLCFRGEGCGLLGHLPRPGPRVSPHTPENINE